ncbi:hypothetical protein FE697_015535 [Mumia zhuanghuii]|uniref:DUF5655 domain-containing protein n=2 Tax=Mumia TaxID=1546255 RepID=A0ABW1QS99_9ACTN|nr:MULTISPECIES: hypothetical protein [Mumia]KAA1420379.1 hypothetical protein FE697_015535 [Mumia zhuanghuii]
MRGSEESLVAATGESYDMWFARLDELGAAAGTDGPTWSHTRIAACLVDLGVDGWWAQHLAVAYEQARGLRSPGQRADGTFSASVSRTLDLEVPAAVARVVPAVADALALAPPELNPAAKNPSGRFRLDDGTIIVIGFSPRGEGRSVVSLEHARLGADADLDAVKARLRELLKGVDTPTA